MKGIYTLLLLAILGIGFALLTVLRNSQQLPSAPSVVQLPRPPFAAAVAGAGMIEAGTGNIAIGTPVAGIVTEMFVKVGDRVKAGEPLFKIDDRDLQAQRQTAIAKLNEAEAKLEMSKHRLKFIEDLSRQMKSAVSEQQLSDLRDEVGVASAALETSQALLKQVNVEIDRRLIRAPVTGSILRINIHLGEYAQDTMPDSPMMILGSNSALHVRVDIDENEAWRVQPGAQAVAFLRSNPNIKIPLRFAYIEPYIVPKTALTGRGTERTDTRVLQVIYSFDKAELPVYVGEQVDVFIEVSPEHSQDMEAVP